MSSNVTANQATNKFEEILALYTGNGASIAQNVDTSNKKTKLSDEAKAALIEQIQKNLSGIDVQDIKSKDNDNGLLSAKVLTLENTSADKLQQMSAVFSDVLKLIQDSDGKVDKTFLNQKSEENPELRAKIIELATVVSITKNEGGSAEATTVKSLSEAVVGKTNPKLFIDSKAGLTQDETNAIKMMLFSDKDSTAFAGALTLLQSVQNYKEVGPDTLIEKEVDGVKTIKAKAGSFYKKIERALGNSEPANFIKQVLKNTVDTALHGRLNDEQQAVLRDDPSLKAVYERVHADLVNIVDDKMRKDVIKPLKEDIAATFENEKITQYFGDINEDKVKGFLRKLQEGILKMIRPSGKGFADNAFGAGSFHETNQKIMNLSNDANSALIALTRLNSSIGTVQQRLEDGGAARLDIPLGVIAKSGDAGRDLALKLFKGMKDFAASNLSNYNEGISARDTLLETVKGALTAGGAQSTAIGGAISGLNDAYKGTTAIQESINNELQDIETSKQKTIGDFIVTKTNATSGAEDAFTIQLAAGGTSTMTLNQENTKFLLAATQTIKSSIDNLEADPKTDTSKKVFEAAAKAYKKDYPDSSVPNLKEADGVNVLEAYIKNNPLSVMKEFTGTNLSVFFGLDISKTNEDKETLTALAGAVPDIKSDISQVKSDLDILSQRIAKQVKDQSGKLAHIALTSGAALKDGLLSPDGETFEVAHSLKQNLFATALKEVRGAAEESLTKMRNMSAEQEADLLKVASNINNNTLFRKFVKNDQTNKNFKDNATALKSALDEMKKDPSLKSFAEEFLANSENKELFNKIQGDTIQDKAKYLALLSNLVLDIVYTQEEDQNGKTTANNVATKLSSFLNSTEIVDNKSDSSSDDVRELRANVNNTKNVLATQPDSKKISGLKTLVDGKIKDFDSFGNIPSDIKENVLDAMVKGLIRMAKNSAVKLEPLAELIKAAQAPSNSNEEEFFKRLKTGLVAA